MDRFLLCENVHKGNDRPLYILQTIKHEMLMELIPYDDLQEVKYSLDDVFDLFVYRNNYGMTEQYMLIVRKFYDLNESEINENTTVIRNHIKKAWNWYKSYMIMEDRTFLGEIDDSPSLN